MNPSDWAHRSNFPPPDRPVALADGEVISSVSWQRLAQIADNARTLGRRLGRSDHYRRKNKVAIARADADLEAVAAETRRRYGLVTLSLCGIVWRLAEHGTCSRPSWRTLSDVPEPIRDLAEERLTQELHARSGAVDYVWKPSVYEWFVDEPRYEFEREDRTANCWNRPQKLVLWRHELKVALGAGAVWTTLPDPLAPDPWTVLDFDPEEGR